MRIAGDAPLAAGRYTSTDSFTPSRIAALCPRDSCSGYFDGE
jgi:hypothetical protein